jgi:hypothetical protein
MYLFIKVLFIALPFAAVILVAYAWKNLVRTKGQLLWRRNLAMLGLACATFAAFLLVGYLFRAIAIKPPIGTQFWIERRFTVPAFWSAFAGLAPICFAYRKARWLGLASSAVSLLFAVATLMAE